MERTLIHLVKHENCAHISSIRPFRTKQKYLTSFFIYFYIVDSAWYNPSCNVVISWRWQIHVPTKSQNSDQMLPRDHHVVTIFHLECSLFFATPTKAKIQQFDHQSRKTYCTNFLP